MTETSHDPIALEILSNALRSVTDETFMALRKSAFSNNIKERHDHSTALFDGRGRLVVQSQKSLPVHIGGIAGTISVLLDKYGGDIHDGDIFIGNDPYVAAGTHLPDICVSKPVFHGGKLVGFSACTAHHSDVGGANVGSIASGLTEIYQEGLRIPLVRLYERGTLVADVFEMILLNMRNSVERRGDFNAQIAAVSLGGKRMMEICDRFGAGFVESACDELITRTHKRMLNALKVIPEGEYSYDDVMDDDGVRTKNLAVKVRIGHHDGRFTVDFEGTSDQAEGNINSPFNDTIATVISTFKSVLDPEIPSNHGLFDAIEIRAPQGTLVNPAFPASVANRLATDQRICDVIMGALAQAIPDKVLAGSSGAATGVYVHGTDPRTGKPFYYAESMGGGLGARSWKDGKDAVQVYCTNTANTPIETIERDNPLIVEEYSIATDTGGAGRFRGGCGLRRVIRPLGACLFGGNSDRFEHPSKGLFGGGAGQPGMFAFEDPDGRLNFLTSKVGDTEVKPLQRIVIQTPGAAGLGKPSERTGKELKEDWESGKFSSAYMTTHYGADWQARQ